MGRGGRTIPQGCARSPINETKPAVLSVMDAFGRPVTAEELCRVWGEAKRPAILDYHLSTLVGMGVVEIVMGPELRFGLVDAVDADCGPGPSRKGTTGSDGVSQGQRDTKRRLYFDKRSNKR